MMRRIAIALSAAVCFAATEGEAQTPRAPKKASGMMARGEPAPLILDARQVEGGGKPAEKPATEMPAEPVESVVMACEPPCVSRCGVLAGAGVMLLTPHWDSNPALINNFAPAGIGGGSASRSTIEFDWDPEFAPLIWVGFQGEDGLGIRGRYWGMRASAGDVAFVNAGGAVINTPLGQTFEVFPFTQPLAGIGSATAGDTLVVANDLDLDVYDLEALQDFRAGRWSLTFIGGVRYAEVGQGYKAVLSNPNFVAGQTARVSADDYSNRFTGLGPTAALEARRPLGLGLYLYGSARASILFGTSRHRATNFDQLIDVAGAAGIQNLLDISSSREEVLPIGEIEVGAEFAAPVGDSARLFLRTALVGQVWHGVGAASAAVSGAQSDLGLYGVSLAVGVDR